MWHVHVANSITKTNSSLIKYFILDKQEKYSIYYNLLFHKPFVPLTKILEIEIFLLLMVLYDGNAKYLNCCTWRN